MDQLVDAALQQLMSSIAQVLLGTGEEAQQQLDHPLLSRRQRQH